MRIHLTGFGGLEDIQKNFSALSRGPKEEVQEGLRWAGVEFVKHMKNALAPVRYTGTLEDSVHVHNLTDEYVTIGPDVEGVPYTEFVLKGGKPHVAPFSAIYAWTVRKLGGEMRDAYAIWWSIRERGTSMWALERYPEEGGGWPFPRITMRSDEAQRTLVEAAVKIGGKVTAVITS